MVGQVDRARGFLLGDGGADAVAVCGGEGVIGCCCPIVLHFHLSVDFIPLIVNFRTINARIQRGLLLIQEVINLMNINHKRILIGYLINTLPIILRYINLLTIFQLLQTIPMQKQFLIILNQILILLIL